LSAPAGCGSDCGGRADASQAAFGTGHCAGPGHGGLAVGSGSRALSKTAIDRPHFFQGLSGVSGGKIVPVPGGVLIRAKSGAILGAVGVSGDTSDNDEAVAIAGIDAAGFTAEG
jgi:uncharacterized protein GlcG (DUF336 family)